MSDSAISKASDVFVSTYYKYFDTQRHLLAKLYKESAAVVWNGNPFGNRGLYQEFYLTLPSTGRVYNHILVQLLLLKTCIAYPLPLPYPSLFLICIVSDVFCCMGFLPLRFKWMGLDWMDG